MYYLEPSEIVPCEEIPDVYTFRDGSRVNNAGLWQARANEIKGMFEYYMYGPLPDSSSERVMYTVGDWEYKMQSIGLPDGENVKMQIRTTKLTISVVCGEKQVSYDAKICMPMEVAPDEGYPVYIEMSFVWPGRELELSANAYYAATRGYATICYNPVDVANDKRGREGIFYDLHPYGEDWEQQTGVLAAWGWGASKILDALEAGLGGKLGICQRKNILSGVSRFGKATLVAGAYDKRIKVVVPACSGAGGAAMYRCRSKGYVYDLASVGYQDAEGNSEYKVGQNEALRNLQSDAEAHWFNDTFLLFESEEQLPLDQHELAALIADENRYLFMISSITEEDWVNAVAMGYTFREARKVYEFLGFRNHICLREHLKGHAILLTDMEKLLDYCDRIFNRASSFEIQEVVNDMQSSIFWKEDGRPNVCKPILF